MAAQAEKFIALMKHPVKFRMFLFYKLPSAFFAGLRLRSIDSTICEVSVPYKWFSQNPFRSTYFACLSMAAEMTTGALAMAHTYQSSPAFSMLVTRVEGDFVKKATGITTFRCEDGLKMKELIADAVGTGEAKTIRARSVGRNETGEVVAEFYITWSFKARSVKSA